MAAAAAALTFAAEPAVNQSVSLSGDASVTWGVDLDTGKTGFKNDANATLEVVFTGEGTKETTGEGIWAEIQAKGTALSVKDTLTTTPTLTNGAASIEKAQLHFGPVYVGIKSGNTLVGAFKPLNAVHSSNDGIGDVMGPDHDQGIVAGFSNDLFAIDVDFRSKKDATYNWYGNDYGAAAEATLKFVPSMEIKVGADYQFDAKALGVGASAKYTLALGDTFKLIPSVGYTMAFKDDNDSSTVDLGMALAAGAIFAWGDEKDANAGIYYLDNDNAKKVTPGVGVVAYINNLTNVTNADVKKAVGDTEAKLVLVPSFYSGEIVPNLTAAALAEIDVPLTSGGTVAFAVAGGLKYNLKVNDSVTITPQAGVRFNGNTAATTLNALKGKRYDDNGRFNSDAVGTNSDNQLMNVKVGADVSGLINNTTFSVDWTSRNLLRNQGTQADNGQIGTINVTCKIAL